MRIKNQKDFWAGLMFIAVGAFFSGFGTQYTIGTAAKMGPGYFPVSLGIIMMLLGALLSFRATAASATEEKVAKFDWYVMFWILGSTALFGALIQPMGLVVALTALVMVSSYASHEHSWKVAIINTIVLIIASYLIFIRGLNLQFQLWPAFLAN